MPSLNNDQFGEQLSLFGSSKPRSAHNEQLQMNFPPHPRLAPQTKAVPPKIDWGTPMRQDRWDSSRRMSRSLGGQR